MRGDRIAMIFQDALTALNPVFKVGDQIGEIITAHHEVSGATLQGAGRRASSTSSASRTLAIAPTSTRTSSRAACASGP